MNSDVREEVWEFTALGTDVGQRVMDRSSS